MRNRKKIIKYLKLFLLLIGFFLIVFSFFQTLKSSFFRIEQVICFENSFSCQADLWFKINGLVLGKNIFFLSPHHLKEEIKKSLIEIDQVEVEKKLPNKLIVSLTKRKPIAVVEAKGEYYQVDYQGIVLTKLNQPTDLPLVVSGEVSFSLSNNKIESKEVINGLDCLYQLLLENVAVSRLAVSEFPKLTIFLRNGPEVLFSAERNLKEQVDSLQLILERAKIEGKQINLIDLRFDKPVISYQ